MDKYNFLDLESSEIVKHCSKLRNEAKFASLTLPWMDIYAFEDLTIIKYVFFLVKNESFQ